jgi:hypothetical protein
MRNDDGQEKLGIQIKIPIVSKCNQIGIYKNWKWSYKDDCYPHKAKKLFEASYLIYVDFLIRVQ